MHQHAGVADMVHVIDVDFKVEDINRRAAARRDAGDLNQRAVRRLQVLANPKLPGFHELLTIHTPERMIVRAAKRLPFSRHQPIEIIQRSAAGRGAPTVKDFLV
jgi:hypothetical protein